MKKLFYAVTVFLLSASSVWAQSTGLSNPQQQPYMSAIIYPPRVSTPSTRDAKADPNPESIWVNREETVNGTLVTTLTPEELLQEVLLGQGNTCGIEGLISNVSFTGYGWSQGGSMWTQPAESRSLSYFSHGTVDQEVTINGYPIVWSLDMESGLLLTTGVGRDAEGPNDESSGCDSPYPYVSLQYDPELSTLIDGSSLRNGAILEFDFVPLQDEISFDYIFASEEYPEFVHSNFNDVFGFFISEVDAYGNIIPGTTQNIALLPNGAGIVSINNVNNGYTYTNSPSYFPGDDPTNPQYYVANYEYAPYQGTYMQFDGRTTVLTARADVVSGNKYHLKLAIANVMDEQYGSGVFLRAGSLNLGSGLKNFGEGGVEIYNVFEGCENELALSFPPSDTETTYIELEYSGSAVNDILQLDNSPMPVAFTVLPLETSVTIPYQVLTPVTLNGGEIQIIATTTRGACERIDTIVLTVYSKVNPEIIAAICEGNDGTITVMATGGSPDAKMSIDDGLTWQPVSDPFSGLAPGDYLLMITDYISCDTLFFPITLVGYPELLQPNPVGATIPYNTTHTFNLGAATGGYGAITYFWQESVDGLIWAAATGTNNNQYYTTPALTGDMYYRRQATAEFCGDITSDSALVKVAAPDGCVPIEPLVLQPKEGVVLFIWNPMDVIPGFLGVKITRNGAIIDPAVIDTFYTDYVSVGYHLYCFTGLYADIECPSNCFVVYVYPQCDAVDDVTATIIEPDKVRVNWMPVEAYGLINYAIFRNDEFLDYTTHTYYIDENVPTGTHIYSVVVNYDKIPCAESEPTMSNEILIETCTPIENLQITDATTQQITLTWEYPDFDEFPVTFDIYRNYNRIANVDELHYTDEGDFTTTLTYCVQPVYETCQSPPVCVTIAFPPCLPVDVTNVVATGNQEEKTVTVNWEYAGTDATFDIFRNNKLIINTAEKEYTDATIEYDVVYKYCITPVATCPDGGSACSTIVMDEPTGINDISTGSISDVRIYPNPTTGLITICDMRCATSDNPTSDIGQSEIEIFDVFGKTCNVSRVTCNENEMDISFLPAGIYFIRIQTDKTVITKPVVVIH